MKIYCIDNSLAADIGNLYTIDTMPQGIPFSLYTQQIRHIWHAKINLASSCDYTPMKNDHDSFIRCVMRVSFTSFEYKIDLPM